MNCGKLLLRKIIKISPTRCHILKLKCTEFDFGWGSTPDPAREAYSAPPDSLAKFQGAYCNGKGRRWEEDRKEREKKERKRGREREGLPPLEWKSGYVSVVIIAIIAI